MAMPSEVVHGVTRNVAIGAVWVIVVLLLTSAVYMVFMTDSLVVRFGILAAVIWVVATVYIMHRVATGLAWLYRPDEAEALPAGDAKSGGSGA